MNGENSADEDVREEEEDEDALEFYDKTKSFFDSISCEALEREKGLELSTTHYSAKSSCVHRLCYCRLSSRPDWKAERKLNTETFGVGSSRYYGNRGYRRGGNYHRGGGYQSRGYRGGGNRRGYRGGHRGGGNFGRRNNQGWVDYKLDTSNMRRPVKVRQFPNRFCIFFFLI